MLHSVIDNRVSLKTLPKYNVQQLIFNTMLTKFKQRFLIYKWKMCLTTQSEPNRKQSVYTRLKFGILFSHQKCRSVSTFEIHPPTERNTCLFITAKMTSLLFFCYQNSLKFITAMYNNLFAAMEKISNFRISTIKW